MTLPAEDIKLIDDILRREGPATDDPVDRGGRTVYGISEAANPQVWADGKVTEAEARAIYESKYIRWPRFDRLPASLQPVCVDWGVTSGPQLVIMNLQSLLSVKSDGIIGPVTLAAVNKVESRWLNNQLVAARVRMIGRIVKRDLSQVKYLNGWLDRALEFLQ